MSKEDSELDYIKDYLKTRGLKSTLDALEKENLDKKKVRPLIIYFYF